MAREYFQAYHSYLETMEQLDDSERGRLFTALLIYSSIGVVPELTGNERYVFPGMRAQIDRDSKSYEMKCVKNRENGSLGGKRSVANGSERPPTPPKEKEKEKTKEKEKEKDGAGDRAHCVRFTPPTLAEVAAYVTERGSPVDPQEFIDFYASKGWLVGKTPMKDWKAACRNAEKWDRWKRTTASERPTTQRTSFTELAARMEQEGKL